MITIEQLITEAQAVSQASNARDLASGALQLVLEQVDGATLALELAEGAVVSAQAQFQADVIEFSLQEPPPEELAPAIVEA